MSLLTGHNADGRNVMASLAARLKSQAAAPRGSAGIPRSMPVSSDSESNDASALSHFTNTVANGDAFKENVQPVWPVSSASSKTSTVGEEDTKMMDINSGPSLLGTADQLAVARQFADTATAGGRRSRPGRERLLSRDTSRASFVSSSSSIRTSTSSPVVRSTYPASTYAQHTLGSPAKASSVASYASMSHNRPVAATVPISEPVSTSPQIQAWKALTADPTTPSKTQEDSEQMPSKEAKVEFSHGHPTSASPGVNKLGAEESPARKLTDVANELKGRAANATIPPHLRAKAAAAGIPPRIAPSATGTQQTTAVTAVTASPEMSTVAVNGKQKTGEVESRPQSRHVHAQSETDITPKQAEVKQVQSIVQTQTEHRTSEEAKPTGPANDSIPTTLAKISQELASVSKRLGSLEEDNFHMQKQLQVVVQAEERRKFLGTDSAKEPFGLDVKLSTGETCRVQAHTELKVYELVRRVRAKANLAPSATSEPRIVVDGNNVGHGMMLGEVGISKNALVDVGFSYHP